MKRILALILPAALLAGCMGDREFVLRQKDIEAKRSWPATYQPVRIRGPLTIPEGGEMVVTVPNMPYSPTAIPDGQAVTASLVKDAMHTGALVGGAIYSIHKANGSSSSTTINNNGGTAE